MNIAANPEREHIIYDLKEEGWKEDDHFLIGIIHDSRCYFHLLLQTKKRFKMTF
jgi:hypothetical protein